MNNTGQTGATGRTQTPTRRSLVDHHRSPEVVIAVLDNGVQTSHPDLAAEHLPQRRRGPRQRRQRRRQRLGRRRPRVGLRDNDNDPNPATRYDNHGTAVAGIAAAVGNNGLGVSGVADRGSYRSRSPKSSTATAAGLRIRDDRPGGLLRRGADRRRARHVARRRHPQQQLGGANFDPVIAAAFDWAKAQAWGIGDCLVRGFRQQCLGIPNILVLYARPAVRQLCGAALVLQGCGRDWR